MAEIEPSLPTYNPLFELLVDDGEDEITGYVAYALYKQKKRDWIKDFRSRQRRSPTASELDEYTRAEALPRNITSLKLESRAILAEYATAITEDQYEKLKQQAFEDALLSQVRSSLAKIENNNSFRNQIKVTAISIILTTFVLIVLSLAVALFGVDVVDGAQKFRQLLSTEQGQSNAGSSKVQGTTPAEPH